jgi:hypothetical protein
MAQTVSHPLLSVEARGRFQSVYVIFAVHEVAVGLVCHPVLLFSPVSIIPPTLRAHLHPRVALTRKKNGWSLGTFRKSGRIG